MIASVRTSFVTTTELNVDRMRKQIAELYNKLYAFVQRATKAKEDKRKEEEENVALCLMCSSTKELQVAIKDYAETLIGAMVMVYEEMSNFHHIVASILGIETNTKKRYAMLKEDIVALDNMHECPLSTQLHRKYS